MMNILSQRERRQPVPMFLLPKQEKLGTEKDWILLDTQSAVDLFCNPRLFSSIGNAKCTLNFCGNMGKVILTLKEDLRVAVQ